MRGTFVARLFKDDASVTLHRTRCENGCRLTCEHEILNTESLLYLTTPYHVPLLSEKDEMRVGWRWWVRKLLSDDIPTTQVVLRRITGEAVYEICV